MTDIPQQALWVRLPRFIGDGILISQSLEPLRQAGVPLVAWGAERVVDLYRGSSAFTAVHPDERSGRNAVALARVLRQHSASAVLGLTRSLRPLAAGWLARVPLRIGWADRGGRLLATHSAPFWQTSIHHFDRYQALVLKAYPGLPPGPPHRFVPRPEAEARASALASTLGLPDGFVACALGAHGWNKRMGTGPWAALVQALAADGHRVVLLGNGPEDEAQATQLRDLAPAAVSLVGDLGLAETAALLRRAGGLVGNDSAVAHLAASVGCPCVVAFGPTRPEWTAPRGAAVRIVRRDELPCLPCAAHGCTVPGHPCMQAFPSDRLHAGLREILLPRPSGGGTEAHP